MSSPSPSHARSTFGNGFIPWAGAALFFVFATLAVVCTLLAVAAATEIYRGRLAMRRGSSSTRLGASSAAVAMLSDMAGEDGASTPAPSLDTLRASARTTKAMRRLAVCGFFGLVLPMLWCAPRQHNHPRA